MNTVINTPSEAFLESVQNMARSMPGHFLFYASGLLYLVGADYAVFVDPNSEKVHGWGDSKAALNRLAKLELLLENSADFKAAENYLVVVSSSTQRALEAAKWIVDTIETPHIFVHWSPDWIDSSGVNAISPPGG